MEKYVVFNICVGAAAVLLAAIYTTLYYTVIKKKGGARFAPSRIICGILVIAIVLIGIENTVLIGKEYNLRTQKYSKANTFFVTELYESDTNPELLSDKKGVIYGQYFDKDSIPGYRKGEKIIGDVKYTYYVQTPQFNDSNDFNIDPNFVIFAEYTGDDSVKNFSWDGVSMTFLSGNKTEDGDSWIGTWEDDIVMIYGRFGYNVDSLSVKTYHTPNPDVPNSNVDAFEIDCGKASH